MWFLGGFGFTDAGSGMVEESGDSLFGNDWRSDWVTDFLHRLDSRSGSLWRRPCLDLQPKKRLYLTMGVLANVSGDNRRCSDGGAGG